MKSTTRLLLSVGLLLGLSNCCNVKQQPPTAYKSTSPHKSLVQVDTPAINNNLEEPETLVFNDDTNSFEEMESFALADNDFVPFDPSSDDKALALNDPNTINFDWAALEEEAENIFAKVHFDWNDSQISQKEHSNIVNNIEYAKKLIQEGETIVCKGKACKLGGTEARNLALSDQRAQSVARELEAAGIPQNKIKAFGVGTQESFAMGDTKEDHAPDRCVEIYTITL